MKSRMLHLAGLLFCMAVFSSCTVHHPDLQTLESFGDGHMQSLTFDLPNYDSTTLEPNLSIEVSNEEITSYSYSNDGRQVNLSLYSLENLNGKKVSLSLYPAKYDDTFLFLKYFNRQVVTVTVESSDPYMEFEIEQNGTIGTVSPFTQIHISPYSVTLQGAGAFPQKEGVELFDVEGICYNTNRVSYSTTNVDTQDQTFAYIGEFEERTDPKQIRKLKMGGKTYFIQPA